MQTHPLALVLDNLGLACTVGSILRTAEAARCTVVPCGITPKPPNPDVLEAAAGAERLVPQQHFGSVTDAIGQLKAEGYIVWAAERTGESVPYDKQPVPHKLALVLGNEAEGVSSDAIAIVDAIVYIPMMGSINVATAANIIAFDTLRRAPWCEWNATYHNIVERTFFEKEVAVDTKEILNKPRIWWAWHNLGKYGGGTVNGQQYSERECFAKGQPFGWNLTCEGALDNGTVGGKHHSEPLREVECLQKDLIIDLSKSDWLENAYIADLGDANAQSQAGNHAVLLSGLKLSQKEQGNWQIGLFMGVALAVTRFRSGALRTEMKPLIAS